MASNLVRLSFVLGEFFEDKKSNCCLTEVQIEEVAFRNFIVNWKQFKWKNFFCYEFRIHTIFVLYFTKKYKGNRPPEYIHSNYQTLILNVTVAIHKKKKTQAKVHTYPDQPCFLQELGYLPGTRDLEFESPKRFSKTCFLHFLIVENAIFWIPGNILYR